MAAFFTGLGTGFERGSAAALGRQGLLGSSSLGRGGENVFVNAATGNLVLQRQDEFLAGLGPDAAVARTYNSLGHTDHDDNGDLWRQSSDRRIVEHVAGVSVKRLSADGSLVTYLWDGAVYVAKDGAGAHERLSYANGVWTWREGGGRISETYHAAETGVWRIKTQSDDDGNTLTFQYDPNDATKLTRVTTHDGAYVEYSWSGANIVAIVTGYDDLETTAVEAFTPTRTRYLYDSSDRLEQVIVDFSPHDDAVSDQDTYWIKYAYDGASSRIASVEQKDGAKLLVGYDSSGRVISLQQTVSATESRVTTIAYHSEAGGVTRTEITDARLQVTKIRSNADGQIIEIIEPPRVEGATSISRYFAYDAGDKDAVTSVTDGAGAVTGYLYDPRGNLIRVTDPTGVTTYRVYDIGADYAAYVQHPSNGDLLAYYQQNIASTGRSMADWGEEHWTFAGAGEGRTLPLSASAVYSNRLLRETTIGGGPGTAYWQAPQHTRYVYDGEGHLRYVINAEGEVTEHTYTTQASFGSEGLLARTTVYTAPAHVYAIGSELPTLAAMDDWRNNLVDRSSAAVTRFEYDARGNLRHTYAYDAASASTGLGIGDGDAGAGAAEGFSHRQYVYDQHGRLLLSKTGAQQGQAFLYDALGRQTLATDLNGAVTAITFTDGNGTASAEISTKAVVTLATGVSYTSVSVFNKAGELISRSDVDASNTLVQGGAAHYLYDKNGQLRRVTDASGLKSYFIYDKAGFKVAEIGHLGEMVEYRYDAAGRVTATVRRGNLVSGTHLALLDNPFSEVEVTANPQNGAVSVLPAASAQGDIWQFSVYDAAGRVIETIQGDGSVVSYAYDQSGRLVSTYGYVNKLSASQVNGFKTAPPTTLILPTADAAKDALTRTFYDRAGRIVGALNGEGYLSEIVYDGAGRKIQEIAYAGETTAGLRAAGSFEALKSGLADAQKDVSKRWVYDGQGLLRYSIDALNHVTEYVYWDGLTAGLATGLVRKTIVYAAPLASALTSSDYAGAKAAVALLSGETRIGYNVYNDRAQLRYSIDAAGAVTRLGYDAAGRVVSTTRYAVIKSTSMPADAAQWESHLDAWSSANGAGARTTRNYFNSRGDLRFVVDGEGYVTQFDHDGEGRVIGERRWEEHVTAGDATTLLDVHYANKGASRLTQTHYDYMGRVDYIIDPTGSFQLWGYLANGLLGWEITGSWADNSRTVFSQYDLAGRKTKEVRYTSAASYMQSLGETATQLNAGQRITSQNGEYAALVTNFGEFEIYHKGERIWTTDTREVVAGASYRLTAQSDGDLVLYRDVQGQPSVALWSSGTEGEHVGASFIRIDNEGAFTLEKGQAPASAGLIWSAGTDEVTAIGEAGPAAETLYSYDGLGNLATVTDPNGNVKTFGYDKLGRLESTSITVDGEAVVTTIAYDAFHAVKTTDARGHESFAYFDQLGRLTLAVDAKNYATATLYNAFGEAASVTRHYAETSAPTTAAKPTLTPHDLDAVTHYVYDKLGRVTLTVDAERHATASAYNAFGELAEIVRYSAKAAAPAPGGEYAPPSADALHDAKTTFAYDLLGRVTATTDAENKTESYALNAHGERLSVVNKAQGETAYVYNGRGLVVKETKTVELAGAATETIVNTFEYDDRGNLLKKIEGYDALTQTALRTTRYEYDKLDRLIRIVHDAQSVAASSTAALTSATPTETFHYDKNGNLIEKRDAAGARTLYWYDALNRLTHQLSASGTLTRRFYDKNGNVTQTRVYANQLVLPANATGEPPGEPSGAYRRELLVYDALNRMVSRTVPDVKTAEMDAGFAIGAQDLTTSYDYDARGNVVRTIDARGGESYAWFDRLNRKTTQIDAALYRSDWSYDADGNVLMETRHALQSAAPTFGSAAPAAPAPSSDDRITAFSYDRMGRRLTERRLNVAVHASFNRLQNPGGYPKQAFSSTAAYESGGVPGWYFWTDDANGAHIHGANAIAGAQWLASGDQSTFVVQQSDAEAGSVYDLGQMVSVTPGETYTFSAYTGAHRAHVEICIAWRDASGQVISTAHGAGPEAWNEAEAAGGQSLSGYKRIWVEGEAPASAVSASLIVRKHATISGADSWMFVTRPQFELSAAGPSTWAETGLGTVLVDSVITYEYNALGQVLAKVEASGERTDYTYDDAGRLRKEERAAFVDHLGAAVRPTLDYAYDALGNLTELRQLGAGSLADRVTTYEYGIGGRLLRMQDAGDFTRHYFYDVAGRVTREEYNRLDLSSGAVRNEAIGSDYDLEGRVVAQGMLLRPSGSTTSWTRNAAVTGGEAIDTTHTQYNAFGEVSARGTNGVYAESFEYDAAGRLQRTNAGDGVWKYFMYDAAGNQTLALASAGADFAAAGLDTLDEVLALWSAPADIATTNVSGVVATITKYDARNQATEVLEPKRQRNATTSDDLVTTRAYNAFGEVAYEINAAGARFDYSYNTMGRVIKTESPTVSITGATGVVTSNYRPTEHRYYDASGRLVAHRDANGNLTQMRLLAGSGYGGAEALVTYTLAPDGGESHIGYDVHGDARKLTDQLDRVTLQNFDAMGRLVEIVRPWTLTGGATNYTESYAFDGLGQRTAHWNNFLGLANAQTTQYDHQGRIVAQVAMGGDQTTYAYAWSGTTSTAGMGVFGGWTQTTTYANGKSVTDKTDAFGRTVQHVNMASLGSDFSYDKAGRLTQRSGGDAISYSYFNTGRAASSSSTTAGVTRTASYGYDKLGNVTVQQLTAGAEQWQNATASYDALGRLVSWSEAGSAYTPAASLNYEYDANGNIRRSLASYRVVDSHGAFAANASTQDYWYRYDAMNRVVTQKGELVGTTIVRGEHGADFTYDAAGQRVSMYRTFEDQYMYNDPEVPGDHYQVPFTNEHVEYYIYDNGGRLTQVKVSEGYYEIDHPYYTYYGPSGVSGATVRGAFVYDAMGRMTSQTDYGGMSGTQVFYSRELTYNAKSQVISDEGSTRQGSDVFTSESTYDYGTGSSYALGAALSIETDNWKNGSPEKTTLTTNTYVWADGAVQSAVAYDSDTGDGGNQINTSTYSYATVGGQLQMTQAAIIDGRTLFGGRRFSLFSMMAGGPRTATFKSDLNGQVIRRDESDSHTTGDPHEFWYRFAGKQLGYVGNNGTSDIDYRASTTERAAGTGSGPFRNGSSASVAHADFDQSLSPINSYYQGSSTGVYTVRGGDTLQSIAATLWGDSSLWYKIADANGLSGQSALIEGQTLIVPQGVMKNTHSASTFSPYDPTEVLGDTAPTRPKPPKKNNCGVFGQVLLVIIAIAVTAMTKGATAKFFAGIFGKGTAAAAVAGGAAAGAAGSIASQMVGVATGIQDQFSWNAVAMAAIGGGVGASGIGESIASKFPGWSQTFVAGAANNAVTQGIGRIIGAQDKFSWAGVAAAGVGAVAFDFASRHLPGAAHRAVIDGVKGPVEINVPATQTNLRMASMAQLVADAGARSLIEGSDFGDNVLAALPNLIGQTIGEAIAGGINRSADRRREARVAEEGQYAGLEYGLPTAGEVLAGDPTTRQPILDSFTAMTGHVVDSDGRIVMDPSFEQYLEANPATAAEIAQSRAGIVAAVQSGDLNVSYDFGYYNDAIRDAYSADRNNPALTQLATDRAVKSVVGLGDTRGAALLALNHYGATSPDAALVNLVVARASGNRSVNYSSADRSIARRAERDVRQMFRYRERFYDGMARTAIALSRFESYANANGSVRMQGAASDMRTAFNSGRIIIMPRTNLVTADGAVASMEQLGVGAQSVIHVYRAGVNNRASAYGFNLFHEYFHTTAENSNVIGIERGIRIPTDATPRPDDYSFYDNPADVTANARQQRVGWELGRRLAGTATTTRAPVSGGGVVAHTLADWGPFNSVVRNIWKPLGL
ncbi:MAG TPA: LysM peptidoglycan-binding domain-containing protein [Vitreimonas sp.]|uniref:LysM peptidoglycan-binding domain-containing protein n=1 Tax=Vitreimonas sp. TaxID=3069702 RepID=UPI002D592EC6|nr:LysM peptidoglycan-binding domain-containing protein [Vitreimonas sp.]HYD86007.1 LysM peptidoglycan-binding domain-containing protein [Vitreimonas sp.]